MRLEGGGGVNWSTNTTRHPKQQFGQNLGCNSIGVKVWGEGFTTFPEICIRAEGKVSMRAVTRAAAESTRKA